jgi:hypothetical protein
MFGCLFTSEFRLTSSLLKSHLALHRYSSSSYISRILVGQNKVTIPNTKTGVKNRGIFLLQSGLQEIIKSQTKIEEDLGYYKSNNPRAGELDAVR